MHSKRRSQNLCDENARIVNIVAIHSVPVNFEDMAEALALNCCRFFCIYAAKRNKPKIGGIFDDLHAFPMSFCARRHQNSFTNSIDRFTWLTELSNEWHTIPNSIDWFLLNFSSICAIQKRKHLNEWRRQLRCSQFDWMCLFTWIRYEWYLLCTLMNIFFVFSLFRVFVCYLI